MKTCLKANSKQSVKFRNGLIKFDNNYKQLAVPFAIYADFESVLKRCKRSIEIVMPFIPKIIKKIFLAILHLNLWKNVVYRLIATYLEEYE